MQVGDKLTSFCRQQRTHIFLSLPGRRVQLQGPFSNPKPGDYEAWRDAVLGFRANKAAADGPIF